MTLSLAPKQALNEAPKPLPKQLPKSIRYVFTDVDDTLTWKGELPTETFIALQQLKDSGIIVIPVTGACYAWCDCLLRTWPISTIIGENGAFWMEKDEQKKITTHYMMEEEQRLINRKIIDQTATDLLSKLPFAKLSEDSRFRVTDIAFDIGQQHYNSPEEQKILMEHLAQQPVTARLSSIHINLWIGNYNKAHTSLAYLAKRRHISAETAIDSVVFIGDSTNDESMFQAFEHTVGVANIKKFLPKLAKAPRYITERNGGHGFADFAKSLLQSL